MWAFDEETIHNASMDLEHPLARSHSLPVGGGMKKVSKKSNGRSTSIMPGILQRGPASCRKKKGQSFMDDTELDSTAGSSNGSISEASDSMRNSVSSGRGETSSARQPASPCKQTSRRHLQKDIADKIRNAFQQRPSPLVENGPRSPAGSKLQKQKIFSVSSRPMDKATHKHDDGIDDEDDVDPRSLQRQPSIKKKSSSNSGDGLLSPGLPKQDSLDADEPQSPSLNQKSSVRSSGTRQSALDLSDGPWSPSLRKKKSVSSQSEEPKKKKSIVNNKINLLNDDDLSAVTFETVPSMSGDRLTSKLPTKDKKKKKKKTRKQLVDQYDDDMMSLSERDLEQGHESSSSMEGNQSNLDEYAKASRWYAGEVLAAADDPQCPITEMPSLTSETDPLPLSKKMSIGGLAMSLSGLTKETPSNSKKKDASNLLQDSSEFLQETCLAVREEFLDEDEECVDNSLDSISDNKSKLFWHRARLRRHCLFLAGMMFIVFAIGMGTGMWFSKQNNSSLMAMDLSDSSNGDSVPNSPVANEGEQDDAKDFDNNDELDDNEDEEEVADQGVDEEPTDEDGQGDDEDPADGQMDDEDPADEDGQAENEDPADEDGQMENEELADEDGQMENEDPADEDGQMENEDPTDEDGQMENEDPADEDGQVENEDPADEDEQVNNEDPGDEDEQVNNEDPGDEDEQVNNEEQLDDQEPADEDGQVNNEEQPDDQEPAEGQENEEEPETGDINDGDNDGEDEQDNLVYDFNGVTSDFNMGGAA
ncbi:hypothetical protein IV203_019971 [Nitzschia inconspicua]|uniref:Uncharacterized protein n=1 Tax=Nitzschia inconspicua TaxID=303405 RepID=A0A9K3M3J8_9STRA|nr:hypothetical protein IV203_019971 [Nitzschia inconspicua]